MQAADWKLVLFKPLRESRLYPSKVPDKTPILYKIEFNT
jgi:hypothetical protein